MVKKKRRKQHNTPRRRRFNRRQRLASAQSWLSTYAGDHVAQAYRRRYGVDWPTAFKELELLGIELDSGYQELVRESVRGQTEASKRRRREQAAQTEELLAGYQGANFAYLAGYTNWGFPYGITWAEMETSELEGWRTDGPDSPGPGEPGRASPGAPSSTKRR
ncbi:MAG: hypothetical protein KKA73_26480 [Chloroflexi bacterium]|nr:hypothetical protein [Chloroflexota bacterium]MBU1751247.1 hypothetical protein [Chloroflexota bacterium]